MILDYENGQNSRKTCCIVYYTVYEYIFLKTLISLLRRGSFVYRENKLISWKIAVVKLANLT